VQGAFHEIAARKYFEQELKIVDCLTFDDVVNAVKLETVDFGMMAIENTISGTILNNYELIRNNDLNIVGETNLRIVQNLGVVKGATLESLETVSSHYMALNQCRHFFRTQEHIQLIESTDTALSLKEVAENGSLKHGAVGSQLAIEMYGLEMLAESIETNKKNYTRFVVLSKKDIENEASNKISFSLVLPHKPDALSKVLSLFSLIGGNLTKIESTPVLGKTFQYRFYLDVVLEKGLHLNTILEVLEPLTDELKILGKYESNSAI
jgi:prephenate dehydratase